MKRFLFPLAFLLAVYLLFEQEQIAPQALPGQAPLVYSPQMGDNLEATLVHAIKNAKSSVMLMTYTLKSGKIIQALNEAAQGGVDVFVVYDAAASNGAEKRLNPKVHTTARTSKGLMHLKLLIIDGKSTWLGSANMTRDSLKSHGNLITNLNSPEFAAIISEKIHQLTGTSYEKPITPKVFTIEGQTIELRFLPDDTTAITRIKELIRKAKKSIRVAMYTFTREDLADALINAKNRGVKVEVILDLNQSKHANQKIVALIQKNGILPLLKDTGGLMHHKFMLIDDEILEHGSANWTKNAFRQNDDYIMILYPLNSSQKQRLQQLWEHL